MPFTEKVMRKKLYKVGKSWVVGGVCAFALTASFALATPSVLGDSSVPDVSANNVQSASDNTTDTQQNTTVTEENDKVQSAVTNDNVTTAASDTTQSADNNVTEKQSDDHALDNEKVDNKQDEVAQTNVTSKDEESAVASTDTDPAETTTDETQQVSGKYVEKDGSWYYYFDDGKNAKGLSTIDNNIQYFDESGKQVKGQYVTIDNQTYYFDKDSGDELTGLQSIDGNIVAFNDEGQQIFNQYYQSENGTTYYFDDKGHAATGIKNIEGKNYYFDNLGQLKKGFSGVIDGQIMTFDQETGQEVSNTTSEIKEGLTTQNTDYSEHNAAHGTDAEDFENIDGYLTASSWYRPTDILRNGTDWEPSTDTDFRPILSVWWPDKNTQVNYLNYMADLGFISNADSFETGDNQSLLNEASNYVQKSIEMKISAQQSTEWLKDAMAAFIVTQPQWNETSEDMSNDHLQNGALTYVNSPLTPDANSNFRLLNRTPTNQTGEQAYNLDNSKGGFELLLANDVDNSNPVVQAEQLNWLYYLMNFGTITANDADANFDGIRVDAVDNVDAGLLQIAADYFKLAYGVDQNDATANQHLSILEDWSHNDPLYVTDQGSNQLTMDDYVHTQLIWSLTKSSDIRGTMQRFVDYYMVDRSNDSTENEAIPNYSFVRAHDSEVQTVIAQIVSDLYPDVENSLAPTTEQLAAAFKVYNEDEKLADKKYTQYNMASAYAMLLTNKDTVPRVYYGDLYTDDGQYMATKSPYYDAINTLLKARVQYVAGGQSMSVDSNDVLTSVRYGKDAMTASDTGTSETRTEGIGVIVSNNAELQLEDGHTVTLHMGAAHKNQAYRALLSTTADGLAYYDTDENAPVAYTDANGDLIFTNESIYGVQNPQVSGYLAVWVPVGAQQDQDARTASDTTTNTSDKVFHSNAALDSQVIYEGFSNFQAFATDSSEYTNVVIAQNADQFKQWGVTSFQLAPQYRSSTDTSFLDSIIQNGYAFTDRYDLGYGTPTKYGTADQLRDAIKALHASGIQAIADWVPDQIYNLPEQELATVTRTNSFGDDDTDSDIDNALYVVQSRGGGQYQEMYGGAFLEELQALYPSLFKVNQISTGVPIDGSVKITEWAAKYFNGSNIQGKGAGYVLKDMGSNKYFKVVSNTEDGDYLPKQLTNDLSETGFTHDDKGIIYYTLSGYRAQNAFIQDDDNNYYYFDKTGHLVTGLQKINNHTYFFLPNGIELVKSFLQNEDGTIVYFDKKGHQVFDQYITDQNGNAYYFDDAGVMLKSGLATIDGHQQYFDQNGVQVKDKFVIGTDGYKYYFEPGSGNLAILRYVQNSKNQWFYFDGNGHAVTGFQTINGKKQYFYNDGHQSKGEFIDADGDTFYTSATDGRLVTGVQKINGITYAFDNTGNLITNQYYQLADGKYMLLDDSGRAKTGFVLQDGVLRYFDQNGEQVKDAIIVDPDTNLSYYFNATQGVAVKNDYFEYQGNWYLTDANYQLIKGFKAVDDSLQHFDEVTGVQTKDSALISAQGKVYQFDNNGNAVSA
ncbi:glycoside hydrolase family 70 protein [Leuconostoc mesenteroides]|jgi:glucan-binding repeat-containing protein|uniref:dextransucrase n=1 Tax=Leuconostoc mesenteroides TaxID=1245 RepID=A0A843YXZ2_LEUME|nr:glycoside hydrolase family 70 protein [Leuconostoc mesenteroides]MBZ1514772.1 KxYKxGKxW signal peptide domain-containing protein [Leuconostoc mesenteroides]MCI2152481.1 KxYKxGKxW signal peptide domain-containing protein [Leuconostoc mesenteroides]MCI2167861.1 KxYKxGKxW signal peptide domain-containing protein [Leuconostoc mesenteroides]MQR27392.1 hydrolase [Leuconostoc mesenteroides]TDV88259.1 putative secreted protein [Leuconostoc mesenteroides]